MALSIGISAGSKITVGDTLVEVAAVINPTLMALMVDGKKFIVSDKERTEIMPEVFVFAGVGVGGVGSRLAFEAPFRIRIHRLGE